MKNNRTVKESISKSISEIMAFFDFRQVALIEDSFFSSNSEDIDILTDKIKEYVIESCYYCNERFKDEKENCFLEGKYNLRFDYIYDADNPKISLSYCPISFGNY